MIKKELLKSKLFIRLIVAVGLVAVALAVLTVMQRFEGGESQTSPPPAPPKPAPHPVPQPASRPAPVSEPAPAVVSQPVSAPIPLPPEPREALPPEPPKAAVQEPLAKRLPRHEHVAKERHPAKVLSRQKVAKHAVRHESGYFTLQFGVFSSDENTEKMMDKLKRQGVNPIVYFRVLVGPYPDREKALLEKKSIGMASSLLPLPGGKYALQFGDFGPQEEAHDLAGKLKLEGRPVMIQARIRGGSYLSREEAEKASKGFSKAGVRAIPVRR
ncbi:MAG: hypothetical protein HKL98_12265 [Burkholderiales bacterium]|nr:hypothetical protein [Burkholderiales bacterium]